MLGRPTQPLRLLAVLCAATLLVAACGGSDADDPAAPDSDPAVTDDPVDVPAADDPSDDLRLNQLTVLGSHNSYHLRPTDATLDGIRPFSDVLANELDYEHRPIGEQLREFGVRQLEIDVYADPDGGRFSNRPALELIGQPTASGEAALDEPGFKVIHQVDVDFLSSCLTLVACLAEVEAFSSEQPDHLPIMIMIETKQIDLPSFAASGGLDAVADLPVDWTEVLTFDRVLWDALESEITSVFDRARIITPDDIRNDAESLEDAVLAGDAWPTLADARGKVLFSLVDTGPPRESYIGDASSLEGRLLFTSSEPGRPDAAFLSISDATTDGARIGELAEAGYLIRTRTDTPGVEAVAGSTERRDAALTSGAHYLSTDYYVEDPELGTGYVVELASRCNPVTAPPSCVSPAG